MGRWRSFFRQRFSSRGKSPSSSGRTIVPSFLSRSASTTTESSHIADETREGSSRGAGADERDHDVGHNNDNARKDHFWNRMKRRSYQLVDFHALPEYLRGNEFILRHYRANWPLKEALLSIFRIHNETLNIWTLGSILGINQQNVETEKGLASKLIIYAFLHLIGFLLFLGLTIYTIWQMPKGEYPSLSKLTTLPTMNDLHKYQAEILACFPPLPPQVPSVFRSKYSPFVDNDHTIASFGSRPPQCILHTMKEDLSQMLAPIMRKPTTRWPFFIFLGGAMLCLLTSSFAHLLCCHSSQLTSFLWRCDYAGISAMIATSFFPPVYYTFMCHPNWRNFYLTSITLIGVLILIVTVSPSWQRSKYRILRTFLFCGMGMCGIIPYVHKVISHSHELGSYNTTTHEIAMSVFYGLGALFYATRIPERWMPGSFDIAGHSHQIFHILVVCGAYTHYKAALLYIEWRDKKGCD